MANQNKRTCVFLLQVILDASVFGEGNFVAMWKPTYLYKQNSGIEFQYFHRIVDGEHEIDL